MRSTLITVFVLITLCLKFSASSLPDAATSNRSSSTVDDNVHAEEHDHDAVVVEKTATPQLAASSVDIIGSALRSTVNNIKPLLAKSSAEDSESKFEEDEDIGSGDYEDRNETNNDESPSEFRPPKNVNETIEILKVWSKITSDIVETVLREVTPLGVQLSYDIKISPECSSQFLRVFNDVRRQQLWAFRLIESYGRITPGVLDGTVSDFGEFDQCVDTTFPKESPDAPQVSGKYCMMLLHAPLPPRPTKHLKVSIRPSTVAESGESHSSLYNNIYYC